MGYGGTVCLDCIFFLLIIYTQGLKLISLGEIGYPFTCDQRIKK